MKYNNNWLIHLLAGHDDLKYVFWGEHQPNNNGSITKNCLSQWWIAPFAVNGIIYRTTEHWLMANKARLFNDEKAFLQIISTGTPKEAKEKGRLVSGFEQGTWDKEKFNIAATGSFYKFSQNKKLAKFLLSTGDSIIAEADPEDHIWGIGIAENDPSIRSPLNWKGENLLGYALMEVRDQLKQIIDK